MLENVRTEHRTEEKVGKYDKWHLLYIHGFPVTSATVKRHGASIRRRVCLQLIYCIGHLQVLGQ